MAWVDVWEHLVILCGLLMVTASIYTIRYPRNDLGRLLRLRTVDHDAARRRVTDPERVQETRRYGWSGLLMGLLFLAMTLPLRDDLRGFLAMVGLCVPFLYVVSTKPNRENVAVVLVLSVATGYGLFVVGAGQISRDLLAVLGGVVGLIGIGTVLSATGVWAPRDRTRRMFHYRCLRCERAFESSTVNMADASCPECGPTRVVTVARGRKRSRRQRPARAAKER